MNLGFEVLFNFFHCEDRKMLLPAVQPQEEGRGLLYPQCAQNGALGSLFLPHSPAFVFPVPHVPRPALIPGLIMKMARG